jgi:hypothetical protein
MELVAVRMTNASLPFVSRYLLVEHQRQLLDAATQSAFKVQQMRSDHAVSQIVNAKLAIVITGSANRNAHWSYSLRNSEKMMFAATLTTNARQTNAVVIIFVHRDRSVNLLLLRLSQQRILLLLLIQS